MIHSESLMATLKNSPGKGDAHSPAPDADVSRDRKLVMQLALDADGHLTVDSLLAPGDDPALDVIADGVRVVLSTFGRQVKALEDAGALRALAERRSPVVQTFGHFAEVLIGSAIDTTVSATELQNRLQVTSDTVDVVFQGDSRELDSLIDNLAPVPYAQNERRTADSRSEARARLRLEALYRKLIRDSFTVKELGVLRLSRQRLQQLRKKNQLFAVEVPNHKGLLHPRWQFDAANRPRPEMPYLIEAAQDGGLDAIGFHQLMLNPEVAEEGAPIDLLDQGRVEDVLEILRAGGG